jgi:hypothetical protein
MNESVEDALHPIGVRAWSLLMVSEDEEDQDENGNGSLEIFLPDDARCELEAELERVSPDQLASAVRSLVTVAHDLSSRGIEDAAKSIVEVAVAATARLTLEKDPGVHQDRAEQHQRQIAALLGERKNSELRNSEANDSPIPLARGRESGVPLRELASRASTPANWKLRGR